MTNSIHVIRGNFISADHADHEEKIREIRVIRGNIISAYHSDHEEKNP